MKDYGFEKILIQPFEDFYNELKNGENKMKLEKKGFFNHPAIGRLNLWLVLNFLEFHLIHHIKQIDKLITNIN